MSSQSESLATKFFKTSNRIEGINDMAETLRNVKNYFNMRDDSNHQAIMFRFHATLGFLNDYCTPGRLRTYQVYVGGRECMHYSLIPDQLNALFSREPRTLEEIKQWHIDFEHIHPFGDGNGRVGRMLMYLQLHKNKLNTPKFFMHPTKVDADKHSKYYSWF